MTQTRLRVKQHQRWTKWSSQLSTRPMCWLVRAAPVSNVLAVRAASLSAALKLDTPTVRPEIDLV
eukprot:scaffold3717_cov124-Isochrysis_galbana.AAC.2